MTHSSSLPHRTLIAARHLALLPQRTSSGPQGDGTPSAASEWDNAKRGRPPGLRAPRPRDLDICLDISAAIPRHFGSYSLTFRMKSERCRPRDDSHYCPKRTPVKSAQTRLDGPRGPEKRQRSTGPSSTMDSASPSLMRGPCGSGCRRGQPHRWISGGFLRDRCGHRARAASHGARSSSPGGSRRRWMPRRPQE